jgi:hypothetical protein
VPIRLGHRAERNLGSLLWRLHDALDDVSVLRQLEGRVEHGRAVDRQGEPAESGCADEVRAVFRHPNGRAQFQVVNLGRGEPFVDGSPPHHRRRPTLLPTELDAVGAEEPYLDAFLVGARQPEQVDRCDRDPIPGAYANGMDHFDSVAQPGA